MIPKSPFSFWMLALICVWMEWDAGNPLHALFISNLRHTFTCSFILSKWENWVYWYTLPICWHQSVILRNIDEKTFHHDGWFESHFQSWYSINRLHADLFLRNKNISIFDNFVKPRWHGCCILTRKKTRALLSCIINKSATDDLQQQWPSTSKFHRGIFDLTWKDISKLHRVILDFALKDILA